MSEADTEALYRVHRDRARGNGGGRSKAGERGIEVLISLATLHDASATRGAYTSLLVMPAVLKRDGSLEPDAENMPESISSACIVRAFPMRSSWLEEDML